MERSGAEYDGNKGAEEGLGEEVVGGGDQLSMDSERLRLTREGRD